jgi:hypothetical protein
MFDYSVTPFARGMRNLFRVEVFRGGEKVATLIRRSDAEAHATGRHYEALLARLGATR